MKRPTYDMYKGRRDIKAFKFRDLHHRIFLGTSSDRYAGWIGQIYTKERYEGHIACRTNTVGGKSFVEEVLPVESVQEYFEHFSVLEIDFTFYSSLIGKEGKPTNNYHVLQEDVKARPPVGANVREEAFLFQRRDPISTKAVKRKRSAVLGAGVEGNSRLMADDD